MEKKITINQFSPKKSKTIDQHTKFSFESKKLAAKSKTIENFYPNDTKSFFGEATLLDNLLLVTEAEPYVPLQIYYKLYRFFDENQDILDNRPNVHKIWNDLQTQLLLPLEDQVQLYLTIEEKINLSFEQPPFLKLILENIIFLVIELEHEKHNNFITEICEIKMKLDKYYLDFMHNLRDAEYAGEIEVTEFLQPKPIITCNLMKEGEFYKITRRAFSEIVKRGKNTSSSSSYIVNSLPLNEPKVHFKYLEFSSIQY